MGPISLVSPILNIAIFGIGGVIRAIIWFIDLALRGLGYLIGLLIDGAIRGIRLLIDRIHITRS